jgi:hypothetical protein
VDAARRSRLLLLNKREKRRNGSAVAAMSLGAETGCGTVGAYKWYMGVGREGIRGDCLFYIL